MHPLRGSKPAVSRVLFHAGLAIHAAMIIYLARRLPGASSDLTRRPRRAAVGCHEDILPSYSVLHQVGFTRPADHPAAGELLPHHFTLTGGAGGMFLWHFPWGRPHWVLPSTLLYGARTFLVRSSRTRSSC